MKEYKDFRITTLPAKSFMPNRIVPDTFNFPISFVYPNPNKSDEYYDIIYNRIYLLTFYVESMRRHPVTRNKCFECNIEIEGKPLILPPDYHVMYDTVARRFFPYEGHMFRYQSSYTNDQIDELLKTSPYKVDVCNDYYIPSKPISNSDILDLAANSTEILVNAYQGFTGLLKYSNKMNWFDNTFNYINLYGGAGRAYCDALKAVRRVKYVSKYYCHLNKCENVYPTLDDFKKSYNSLVVRSLFRALYPNGYWRHIVPTVAEREVYEDALRVSYKFIKRNQFIDLTIKEEK